MAWLLIGWCTDSGQDGPGKFLSFLRVIAEVDEPGEGELSFTLGTVSSLSDKVDQLLLRIQSTAIHSWIESLNSMPQLDAAIMGFMNHNGSPFLSIAKEVDALRLGVLCKVAGWHVMCDACLHMTRFNLSPCCA